ncbi:hypothetical protein WA158_003134 [Blastocystis sp. Blastoise]
MAENILITFQDENKFEVPISFLKQYPGSLLSKLCDDSNQKNTLDGSIYIDCAMNHFDLMYKLLASQISIEEISDQYLETILDNLNYYMSGLCVDHILRIRLEAMKRLLNMCKSTKVSLYALKSVEEQRYISLINDYLIETTTILPKDAIIGIQVDGIINEETFSFIQSVRYLINILNIQQISFISTNKAVYNDMWKYMDILKSLCKTVINIVFDFDPYVPQEKEMNSEDIDMNDENEDEDNMNDYIDDDVDPMDDGQEQYHDDLDINDDNDDNNDIDDIDDDDDNDNDNDNDDNYLDTYFEEQDEDDGNIDLGIDNENDNCQYFNGERNYGQIETKIIFTIYRDVFTSFYNRIICEYLYTPSILQNMFISSSFYTHIQEIIPPKTFWRPACITIYKGMKEYKLTELTAIHAEGTLIDDTVLRHLCRYFREYPSINIHTLYLNNNNLAGLDYSPLFLILKYSQLNHLTSIYCDRCYMDKKSVKSFFKLLNKNKTIQLQTLHLLWCYYEPFLLNEIRKSLQNNIFNSIYSLLLGEIEINNISIPYLKDIYILPSLKELIFYKWTVDANYIAPLLTLSSSASITVKELSIQGTLTKETSESYLNLLKTGYFDQIDSIKLSDNNFNHDYSHGDAFFSHFCDIIQSRNMMNITRLELCDCSITDMSFEKLFTLIQNKQLINIEYLFLNNNKMTGYFLIRILPLLNRDYLPHIKTFEINGNPIGDVAAMEYAKLLNNKQSDSQDLSLGNTGITDKTVSFLLTLIPESDSTCFTHVNLEGNSISFPLVKQFLEMKYKERPSMHALHLNNLVHNQKEYNQLVKLTNQYDPWEDDYVTYNMN